MFRKGMKAKDQRHQPAALSALSADCGGRERLARRAGCYLLVTQPALQSPSGNASALSRRLVWLLMFLCMIGLAAQAPATENIQNALRVGLTPAFLHDQHDVLEEWRVYMERKLGRRVHFVLRDTYRETIDLLRREKLDFAWISDYPFVYLRREVRLLAAPIYRGRPYYRAYVIVPSTDSTTSSILQLRGKVFAYADPYSNTGYLFPRYVLSNLGENPARFFRKTFFAWAHRHVIEAVAAGLADGGSVDSLVWESLAVVSPEITSATRIVSTSPEYGSPPFVALKSASDANFRAMQDLLFGMVDDAEGERLLRRLNIDGFTQGDPRNYDEVAHMMRTFGEE